MLVSSVILVLREVLEAALLFSLLMALSKRLHVRFHWVGAALFAGFIGAAVYGLSIDRVSEWFDGVGQEVVNAFLQLIIYALLCVLAATAMRARRGLPAPLTTTAVLMASSIALAIVREGSEILIYLSGFMQVESQSVTVLAGSAVGAGIGISAGVVFYYALLSVERRLAGFVGAGLLTLVAAGMTAQATQLLIQADWLPAQYPFWDSSWLIAEQTVTGQVLYALIGYEATPSALQLWVYGLSIVFIAAYASWAGRVDARSSLGHANE